MELYFNDSMQTVYACNSGGGGSQQREVADGGRCSIYRHRVKLVENFFVMHQLHQAAVKLTRTGQNAACCIHHTL